MALSASAKDYLSRFFPGPPSPLWETDPEFMELFANFALDECCFANKLRKFFKQSAKKKRRLKGF